MSNLSSNKPVNYQVPLSLQNSNGHEAHWLCSKIACIDTTWEYTRILLLKSRSNNLKFSKSCLPMTLLFIRYTYIEITRNYGDLNCFFFFFSVCSVKVVWSGRRYFQNSQVMSYRVLCILIKMRHVGFMVVKQC